MVAPPVTTGMLLVFGLIGVALVLFVTEALPPDATAVGVLVALAVAAPVTGVTVSDALAGFASPATLTIVAMYVLSEGVRRTGVVEELGAAIRLWTDDDEDRLLGATVGVTGLAAGVVNNTPVVAVFIPMVSGLAERAGVSPSKLLLPLSYAAMLGGTLTLVGTATNLLASDLSARLLGRPISMFEFTPLGLVVFAVGAAYLLTVGRWLLPERVPPADVAERYAMEAHLARVTVTPRSPLVGEPVREALADLELDLDVLRVERDGENFIAAATDRVVEVDDVLTVRATQGALDRVAREFGLRLRARDPPAVKEPTWGTLVEVVLPAGSGLVGETPVSAKLRERFDATVLAVRRGEAVVRERLDGIDFGVGDTVLLQAPADAVAYLEENGDVLVSHRRLPLAPEPAAEAGAAREGRRRPDKTTPALGILLGVVLIGATGLVPVVIAALGGVVAMVATGCLRTAEAYDAVSWNVVFLLAGLLPLGVAMDHTGGSALVAHLLGAGAAVLPPLVVLGLFYMVTGLLANVITPVASVVLLVPVAVETAARMGVDGFPFVLAAMFAASTAFMTPVGYQTNLMVYGPGGYRFVDYVRVGAPLQLLLAAVTTLGIAVLWPL